MSFTVFDLQFANCKMLWKGLIYLFVIIKRSTFDEEKCMNCLNFRKRDKL